MIILHPNPNNSLACVSIIDAAHIEKFTDTLSQYIIVDSLNIDTEFFNAYDYSSEGPVLNTSRAKEIWKNKFRVARKPILEKLDIEYIRSLEAGDVQKQQEVVFKKQQLRDITNVSLPDDLNALKNTWPDVLNS
jgi:hypothetical protein